MDVNTIFCDIDILTSSEEMYDGYTKRRTCIYHTRVLLELVCMLVYPLYC